MCVVWLTFGVDPGTASVTWAAQRLNQENRPCHLVWDPLTGDLAQLRPTLRAGCVLGTPERLEHAPRCLPYRLPSVNREGRLCLQIGVHASERESFTNCLMIRLGNIPWLA